MSKLKENLRRLMNEQGFNQKSLSLAAGKNETAVRDILERARNPRQDTLSALAGALGVSVSELLGDDPSPRPDDGFVARPVEIPAQSQMPRTLPVYGQAACGDDGAFEMNGEVLDYVEMPPSLMGARNPYGVYISGESMSPRYEPGWLVHVHPHKPCRPGDNVVVQLRPQAEGMPPLAYVKVLVSRTGGKLTVRQFNPERTIVWSDADVVSVHKVVGVAHE